MLALSCEHLELGYEGTVLYVSHDRYFINRTATRILDLTGGQLVNYIGDYDYYASHREERMSRLLPSDEGSAPAQTFAASSGKTDWQEQKKQQKEDRRLANELKKCEEEIASLEARNKEIDSELALPEVGYDLARLRTLSDEQQEINSRLEILYAQWEELA